MAEATLCLRVQRPRLVVGATLGLVLACALGDALPLLALGWNAVGPLVSAFAPGPIPALAPALVPDAPTDGR